MQPFLNVSGKQYGEYCWISGIDLPDELLREIFTKRLDAHAVKDGMKVDPASVRWGKVDLIDFPLDETTWVKGDAYPIDTAPA